MEIKTRTKEPRMEKKRKHYIVLKARKLFPLVKGRNLIFQLGRSTTRVMDHTSERQNGHLPC